MLLISTVGLFPYDKFEETTNEIVINLSKLTKSYFKLRYSNVNTLNEFFLTQFCSIKRFRDRL